MLHAGARVLHLDVGEGVRAALIADQQRVALGVVACSGGALQDFHLPAIGVLAVTGGDALGRQWCCVVFLPMWIILVPVSAC